jgi:dUTP pyrophosphatase
MVNATGTIDADYRGEVCLILINLSKEKFLLKDGERIFKMIIAKHEITEWITVDNIIETDRSTGGFSNTWKE